MRALNILKLDKEQSKNDDVLNTLEDLEDVQKYLLI